MNNDETKKQGNVKIINGSFKVFASFAPYLLGLTLIGTGIGLEIDAGKQIKNIINDYKLTETYIERNNEEYKNIIDKYEKGEISKYEREELINNLTTEDYVKNMINEERDENIEFQSLLKQKANLKLTGSILLYSGDIINILSFLLGRKLLNKISESGFADIEEGIKLKNQAKFNTGASNVINRNNIKNIFNIEEEDIVGDLDEKDF